MIPYVGWGCPTCEVGNPATRKRCKNCGRKRPEKYTLTTFHRAPTPTKPKRSKAMAKAHKKMFGPKDFAGTVTGRFSSRSWPTVSNIPKTLPVETKLAARFSDGSMSELQTDGSVTCTCAEFHATKTCPHKAGIEEFIAGHPLKKKKET